MTAFNGQRLQALRELEGLTQSALAARLGTSQPAIAKIENAERPLRPELTAQACAEFAVPEAFFAVPPSLLDVSFPTFRKRSGARAADERRIVRLGREAARAFEAASLSSGYHEVSLPDDLPTMDPEAAAVALRTDSGIDADAPILNVTRFLERLGFGVVTLLEPRPSIEPPAHVGISIPTLSSTRPVIGLTAAMPGAVMRFTLAHELAHHIWDRSSSQTWSSTRSPEERRAHAFAGALLLPREVIEQRVTETLTLDAYLRIKADYGASVGAIIIRAQRLGCISPHRARSLQIQLSSRGWRRNEPVAAAVERPLLFSQALQRATNLVDHDIETLTGLPVALVHHWIDYQQPPQPVAPVLDIAQWRERR